MTQPTVYRTISQEDVPEDWLLLKSVYPVMTCLLLYLLVVTLGPRLMRTRDPFQLTTALRIYNVLQIFQNAHMIYCFVFYRDYIKIFIDHMCMLPDGPNISAGIQIAVHYSWRFLLTKMLDLFDTGFMVLRKKNSHITFLHVYHHMTMVFSTWYTFRFSSFYHGVPLAIINTFVHLVMYSYYFLATYPQLKEHLWWKRYLTKLQVAQFVVDLAYIILLSSLGCPVSLEFTYIWMFNVFLFLLMFIHFYVKAYILNKSKMD